MTDAATSGRMAPPPGRAPDLATRLHRLVARPAFQRWAAAFPLTRNLVRRDGAAMFDLVAGFCHSQVLAALVELRVCERLLDGPADVPALSAACDVPAPRMTVLLRAGSALGLLRQLRGGRYGLTRRGAALTGVPGLREMILHHRVLYRDLADPAAFFRGETETELAGFWPYVLGGGGDAATAARYSDLMADSVALLAEDTLAAVDLRGVRVLMDIGGGTGAFAAAACRANPGLKAVVLDLPAVAPGAAARFAAAGLSDRARVVPGSFRDPTLPQGADAISMIRVLYDHSDATVADLLRAVHAALPAGGRVLVSEPMAGAAGPERAGDAYFAIYTMAMRTGRTRTPSEVSGMLAAAGFRNIRVRPSRRPFVATVITAFAADDSGETVNPS